MDVTSSVKTSVDWKKVTDSEVTGALATGSSNAGLPTAPVAYVGLLKAAEKDAFDAGQRFVQKIPAVSPQSLVAPSYGEYAGLMSELAGLTALRHAASVALEFVRGKQNSIKEAHPVPWPSDVRSELDGLQQAAYPLEVAIASSTKVDEVVRYKAFTAIQPLLTAAALRDFEQFVKEARR